MSLYIDVRFLSQLSHRLPNFKRKDQYLFNCRCILCGDSLTNKNKARGFFYRQKNDLFYKCHNCAASMHFGTFLKKIDQALYKEYVLERYAKGMAGPKSHKEPEFTFEEPKFNLPQSELKDVAIRLSLMPEETEVRRYVAKRGIPEKFYDDLYFIEQTKHIVKIAPKYGDSYLAKSNAPRLLIPFMNMENQLVGVTMRAIRDDKPKFITCSFKEDEVMVFGLSRLDYEKPIKVVEGPIDSMFLENSVACNGVASGMIERLGLPKDKIIIVFDNEPRKREVVKIIGGYVEKGFRVVIWPEWVKQKDINDMVIDGVDVETIIDNYNYQGLEAKLEFLRWRKC